MTLPPSLLTSSPAAVADPPTQRVNIHFAVVEYYRTCGNQVVNNHYCLAWPYGIGLYLERILKCVILELSQTLSQK